MQYRLSQHAKDVIAQRGIEEAWIEQVLMAPSLKKMIDQNEVHYYASIEAYENRCLKVVYNPQKRLIVTVYFDRGMRKKGCK